MNAHTPDAIEFLKSERTKLRNTVFALNCALVKLVQLHADSVFVCGEDDQAEVDKALELARQAIAKAEGRT